MSSDKNDEIDFSVSAETVRDLGYALERARQAYENARALCRHDETEQRRGVLGPYRACIGCGCALPYLPGVRP